MCGLNCRCKFSFAKNVVEEFYGWSCKILGSVIQKGKTSVAEFCFLDFQMAFT